MAALGNSGSGHCCVAGSRNERPALVAGNRPQPRASRSSDRPSAQHPPRRVEPPCVEREASARGLLRGRTHGRHEAWQRARNPCSRQQASANGGAFLHGAVCRGSRVVRLCRLRETAGPVLGGGWQRCGCHPIWAMRQRAARTIVFRDADASCSSNDRHAGTAHVPRAGGRNRFFLGIRWPFGTRR